MPFDICNLISKGILQQHHIVLFSSNFWLVEGTKRMSSFNYTTHVGTNLIFTELIELNVQTKDWIFSKKSKLITHVLINQGDVYTKA